MTFEALLELWAARTSAETVKPFIRGLEVCSGTADVGTLREAGWEEDGIVLLLCCIWLDGTASGEKTGGWATEMVPGYIADLLTTPAEDVSTAQRDGDAEAMETVDVLTEEYLEHAASIMELVCQAREAQPESSLWGDDRWSERLIAGMGLMVQFESLTMMVPTLGTDGSEEARLVLYVHAGT